MGVDKRERGARRDLRAGITRRSDPLPVSIAEQSNVRPKRMVTRTVSRAIVDENDFGPVPRVRANRINRAEDLVTLVMRSDDDAD